jgi:hypothetical protein
VTHSQAYDFAIASGNRPFVSSWPANGPGLTAPDPSGSTLTRPPWVGSAMPFIGDSQSRPSATAHTDSYSLRVVTAAPYASAVAVRHIGWVPDAV